MLSILNYIFAFQGFSVLLRAPEALLSVFFLPASAGSYPHGLLDALLRFGEDLLFQRRFAAGEKPDHFDQKRNGGRETQSKRSDGQYGAFVLGDSRRVLPVRIAYHTAVRRTLGQIAREIGTASIEQRRALYEQEMALHNENDN